MIRSLVGRPVAVAMAYLAVALLGWAAWRNIPIELLPDTRLPRLTVTSTWRGASPEAVEAFVTSPIEAAIQQVRGVERVESVSTEERASIQIEFQRGADLNFARLELSERLGSLEQTLPPGATPPAVSQYVPQEFQDQVRPFLRYTVTGPYTTEALRAHTDAVIVEELLQIDGVATVQVNGGRQRLIEIELDEERTGALGLSVSAVRNRIARLEDIREAGIVEVGGLRHSLAIRQRASSLDELRSLQVLTLGGRTIRLGEIAHIRDTYEEPVSHYRIDGRPAISFSVQREYGSNIIDVADRVRARIDELGTVHPARIRLILDGDESETIRTQFDDMRSRALFSAVVIFIVLLLFLRSFRSSTIIFATIAFSVLITLNGVYRGGMSLNMLTLMGLTMGFGLVVDNAIVVLENVYRLRREGLPARIAAERGTREMVLPVLAATVTTLIVIIPFVYLQGELRLYYVPLGVVVAMSILASVLVSFTFIPALAARILEGGEMRQPPVTDAPEKVRRRPWYVRFYGAFTGLTLRFPWTTVILAALMVAGSWWLFDNYVNRAVLWRSFAREPTYIQISMTLPRGEELARVDEMAQFFEERIPGLQGVGRFVTNVTAQNAQIRVEFPDSVRFTVLPLIAQEMLQSYAVQLGGSRISVVGFGPAFSSGGLGGMAPNYTIRILGFNYEQVREIAEDLSRRLTQFTRVGEVNTNAADPGFSRERATELVVQPDRRRLALYGLSAQDLVIQVNAAIAGSQGVRGGNAIRVGGEQLPFVVKLEGHERMDVLALQNVAVRGQDGGSVRLGDVATISERDVLSRITRVDQQYERSIGYEFRGPTRLGDIVRDAVIESTEVPPGYSIVGRREFAFSTEDRRQIYTVMAIGILLVFMVTAALFESIRQPVIILLTVPMALVGVFLTFFYTNASFTREAYIGVVMMCGIVVNNAILLVDHINHLRRAEGRTLEVAILQGTLDRTRPILMTSSTTIVGLLPLVLFSDSPDGNIWNALSYVLMGGLTSSTLFVLTVTPALYLLFERRGERRLTDSEGPAAGNERPGFAVPFRSIGQVN